MLPMPSLFSSRGCCLLTTAAAYQFLKRRQRLHLPSGEPPLRPARTRAIPRWQELRKTVSRLRAGLGEYGVCVAVVQGNDTTIWSAPLDFCLGENGPRGQGDSVCGCHPICSHSEGSGCCGGEELRRLPGGPERANGVSLVHAGRRVEHQRGRGRIFCV